MTQNLKKPQYCICAEDVFHKRILREKLLGRMLHDQQKMYGFGTTMAKTRGNYTAFVFEKKSNAYTCEFLICKSDTAFVVLKTGARLLILNNIEKIAKGFLEISTIKRDQSKPVVFYLLL